MARAVSKAAWAAVATTEEDPARASSRSLDAAVDAAAQGAWGQHSEDQDQARAAAHRAWMSWAPLIRCVFGNPFRPPLLQAAWLTWNDGCVRKLADGIYGDRRFEDLPVLADALEDAGCQDEAILTHCRSPMEHVRGCWVVDLILEKS